MTRELVRSVGCRRCGCAYVGVARLGSVESVVVCDRWGASLPRSFQYLWHQRRHDQWA